MDFLFFFFLVFSLSTVLLCDCAINYLLFLRRPSAKSFLESQFFPPTIRCAYLFLAPLQLLAKAGHRIKYAAKLASVGALRAMGTYAAEMCAPFCLSLIMSPLSNVEAESALCLLKEFLKCLNSQAIKTLVLPSIQKILQVIMKHQ